MSQKHTVFMHHVPTKTTKSNRPVWIKWDLNKLYEYENYLQVNNADKVAEQLATKKIYKLEDIK